MKITGIEAEGRNGWFKVDSYTITKDHGFLHPDVVTLKVEMWAKRSRARAPLILEGSPVAIYALLGRLMQKLESAPEIMAKVYRNPEVLLSYLGVAPDSDEGREIVARATTYRLKEGT